ncbi:MAG: hypothetical protein WEF86_11465 [Gemmatimonadota bacterium]
MTRSQSHLGRGLAGLCPLLRWTGRLVLGRFRLVRIHVACAEPLRLDAHSRAADLGRAIVAGLQRHAVTTTFHLRAFCLDHAHRGIEPAALRAAITRMPADAAVRAHVDRHGFWFPQPPLPDGAVTDAVVDALFEPIRRGS